jgi:hypothetical protein
MQALKSSIIVVIATTATLGVAAAQRHTWEPYPAVVTAPGAVTTEADWNLRAKPCPTCAPYRATGPHRVVGSSPCYRCAPVRATKPHKNAGPHHGLVPHGGGPGHGLVSPCYGCAPVRAPHR